MAPSAADPRQILVVCNEGERQDFYHLIESISFAMRTELEVYETAPDQDDASKDKTASPNNSTETPEQSGNALQRSFGDIGDHFKKLKKRQPSGSPLVLLRRDALKHFDSWRKEVLKKLREVTSAKEDDKILEARKKRAGEVEKMRQETRGNADLIDSGDTETSDSKNARDVTVLQQHYLPMPSPLSDLPTEDRRELLSCLLLIMLSTGSYSAHSRVLALRLASSFELPLAVLITEETEISKYLVEASTAEGKDGSDSKNVAAASTMSGDAEAAKRRKDNQSSRFWKVGLASVAGAAVIGVTGGLAAPVVAGALGGIMGGIGLGGVASFLGIFWANGALVGALFGAWGAKMTGEMMDTYAQEVNDFRFLPLRQELATDAQKASSDEKQSRRLRVTIGVNGWLREESDVKKPWYVLGDESEVFALRYELKALLALGSSFDSMVRNYAWKYVKMEILKRTVLASLSAVLWPAYLISGASNIDNPFHLARNRSEKAGRVLADALINRAQGERPVTLVGFSLGARAIHSCLKTLADRKAFGIVDSVVLIGAPTPSNTAHWEHLRSVVAGRIFNVYSSNDYILGFCYRATSLQFGIAGLQPIEGVPGVENVDLSDEVAGHLRYPDLIAQILARCGFPDVKGGDVAIEQDEDLVMAREGEPEEEIPEEARAVQGEQPTRTYDEDDAEDEDDEGPPPPLPKRRTVETPPEEKKTIVKGGEQKAPPPWAAPNDQGDGDPLGLGSLGKQAQPGVEGSHAKETQRKPVASQQQPPPSIIGLDSGARNTETSEEEKEKEGGARVQLQQASQAGQLQQMSLPMRPKRQAQQSRHDDHSDEDEFGGSGGINMVDND